MYIAEIFHQTARLTFGRETAQFKQLIALMAVVSITIWSIVFATMLMRAAFYMRYRRRLRPNNNFSQP